MYLFNAQLVRKGEKYNQSKKENSWKLVAKKNMTSYLLFESYAGLPLPCSHWCTARDLPETCCGEFPAKYASYLQQVSRGFRLYIIDGPHCTYLLQ